MGERISEEHIEPFWARAADDVLAEFGVSRQSGLSQAEAMGRLALYGRNALREARRKSAWLILYDQLKSLTVLLLVAAALVSFSLRDFSEGGAILAVIVINTAVGFFTELRAVRSMEALRKLGTAFVRVRRDGELMEIPAEGLVPGDIVIVEGGDVVTADMRLVYASRIEVDESALTGESVPVAKSHGPVPRDTPLAERANMLYKGTSVTRGSGEAVVVATGMDTELGRITSLVEEAKEEETPLEKRLGELGRQLIWLTLGLTVVIAALGILRGKGVFLMFETAIALAVAAIPEGLPIVATIALARGVMRMASRSALVNRLSAVETLGATRVIFTDKTGTLTENVMTARRLSLSSLDVEIGGGVMPPGDFYVGGKRIDPLACKLLRRALEVGVLCNNASLGGEAEGAKPVGDPLEVALLVAGAKAGIYRGRLLEEMPEVRQEAFSSEEKMMATVHRCGEGYVFAVKGAPEAVIEASSHVLTECGVCDMGERERSLWLERNAFLAASGLRVLALAQREAGSPDEEPYVGLTLVGLVGLLDPLREEVRDAIERCREAGLRVVMVTGDQPTTALIVGTALGLCDGSDEVVLGSELKPAEEMTPGEKERVLEANVFARVTPRHKLDLVAIYQEAGLIVAMTGDGVNDAPALKKADIGIAMGMRGTQVAREAADMVLRDDSFATIVAAIEEGRVIFGNIRKVVFYLLSCNVSEVMTVAMASLAGSTLPILPLQILFLNLVTDVFPALALVMGRGTADVMRLPPRRPEEGVLTRGHWYAIGGYGFVMTASTLASLWVATVLLGAEEREAVTVSFLTIAFSQLFHVFNVSEMGSGLFANEIWRNRYVWGALALCSLLLVLPVYVPRLRDVLSLAGPGSKGWVLVLSMSLVTFAVGQVLKYARVKRKTRNGTPYGIPTQCKLG
jgi:Ca2+-transporting ATPase